MPSAADRDELLSYVLTRRGALAGSGAALIAALVGVEVFADADSAAASTAPANASEAAALALSFVGYSRANLNAYVNDSPWSGYPQNAAWCAWFASWFMRSASGVGYQTYASGLYNTGAPVSSPAVGDICYYPGDGHVGMVVGVSGGVAAVVEGNAGDDPGIVKYRPNGPYTSNHLFSRPAWPSGGGSSTGAQLPMAMLFNNNNTYLWALAGLGQAEAGWIETTDEVLAAKFSQFLKAGPTIVLTPAQWNDIKAKFTAQY